MSEPVGRGLLRVPAGGGSPNVLEALAQKERTLLLPQILPGGKAILVTNVAGNDYAIQVLTAADHRRKTVEHVTSACYIPVSEHEGYLVYTKEGNMFAVSFDLDKLETRGTALPILNDVAYTSAPVQRGQFAYSRSGTLVYRTGGNATVSAATVQWIDAGGNREPLLANPAVYTILRFSPDGKQLAITVGNISGFDISVYDPQRDRNIQLTFGGGLNQVPIWTPDGRFVVFSSGNKGLAWTHADGSGEPKPLVPSNGLLIPSSFSPDRRLAYYDTESIPQIWTVPIEEDASGLKAGKPEHFLKDQSADVFPMFSRDGRWLAYVSNRSGTFETYVRPFSPSASAMS